MIKKKTETVGGCRKREKRDKAGGTNKQWWQQQRWENIKILFCNADKLVNYIFFLINDLLGLITACSYLSSIGKKKFHEDETC